MSDDVKWKMQYRHTSATNAPGEWFDIPYTGNITPRWGGTIEVRMIEVPGKCAIESPFSIDGDHLRCEREYHINDGPHSHDYDHSEHTHMCNEDENCYHRIEW